MLAKTFELNDKRIINGWAFYDWANSSYALVISSAIFPAYFLEVTTPNILIGNLTISNSTFYAYSISLAYLIIAAINPFLSGIADAGGRRKMFLRFFTILGSFCCAALFFFKGMTQLWLGTVAFMLATIGFTGSLVFYDAYLPEIVTEDRLDKTSAKGYSYGYIGSIILLLINLMVILKPDWFGIPAESTLAVRLGFIMVGLWWFGFAQITFYRLPGDQDLVSQKKLFRQGYQQINHVWHKLRHLPDLKRFLIAYFFYSAGVQTVLYLAATFAKNELHFESFELIIIILILQLVAIGGAYLFARVSEIKGNKWTLLLMLYTWTVICGLAYAVQEKLQFYLIAGLVGLVMGGIQALSRSTYSKLIEDYKHDVTSFFSFFDVVTKLAIIVGTFSFGFAEFLTGSMRGSVLVLATYFIIGILVLFTTKAKAIIIPTKPLSFKV